MFRRDKTKQSPVDPAAAELGREYAIARRHGDRKRMKEITRRAGEQITTDTARTSFEQGQRAYDDVPPAYRTRRNRRR